MKLRNPSAASEDSGEEEESVTRKLPQLGNKNASKDTRRIELGWIHNKRQVRTKCGGGTRKVVVPKKAGYEDLLKLGKELFFPAGQSKKGPLQISISVFLTFKRMRCRMTSTLGSCMNR